MTFGNSAQREFDPKPTSLTYVGIDLDRASMQLGDELTNRQTKAAATCLP